MIDCALSHWRGRVTNVNSSSFCPSLRACTAFERPCRRRREALPRAASEQFFNRPKRISAEGVDAEGIVTTDVGC